MKHHSLAKFVLFGTLAIMTSMGHKAQAQSQGGSADAAAPDVVNRSTTVISEEQSTFLKKGFFDFYSESSYYYDYDFVTDSRLRYYQPITDIGSLGLSAYMGANVQYQSPGAISKYYDNTVNPNVGLQLQFYPGVKLQGQVGYRTLMSIDGQEPSSTWDPRMIASAGHLQMWGMTQNFSEGYFESAYVPRLDPTPVTLVWLKQGYRWFTQAKLTLDAYGEIYQRVSNSNDLGPTMTEWRAGGRATWSEKSWNVSALVFHPFQKHTSEGELEGLLALGGQF
ncbi:hypothetical protein [Bdellovibrio sp. HCB274]|uniref:hypothetical protein n=1 Tax=Bdellovibrio sp. HCB274 TaxID=3394361 RepID=UPI0039B65040